MYHKTIEEESLFLYSLWDEFNDWSYKNIHSDVKTETIESKIKCPKCKKGVIINRGMIRNDSGYNVLSMRHRCSNCNEEFDRIAINEDIYQHTPFEIANSIETPLGKFQVKKNGNPISFKYRIIEHDIDGIVIPSFFINIDTSDMDKGDTILSGIEEVKLSFRGSDEQCTYLEAEDDDWYLVLNGEVVDEWEVDDINEYTFTTEGYDENGFEYLIHQEPDNLKDRVSRLSRVIQISLAWDLKTISDDYENIIEQAAW